MFFRTAALVLIVCAAPAAAQPAANDPIYAGYMQLYAGEREGAFKHFEPSLAPSFENDIAAFLDHADERYSRSRADVEALFYLVQGHLLRSRYRLDHDKGVFGAARDAAKAKGYADTYIKRHPEHGDAYLALGLYNYYVDIAPNFVKVLRVLLFLPTGNRSEGLKQLERASREGRFFSPLAEAALADIYGTFEFRLSEAIASGERLVQRFPRNADLRFDLAGRYMHPTVEAYDRAAEQYNTIIEQKRGRLSSISRRARKRPKPPFTPRSSPAIVWSSSIATRQLPSTTKSRHPIPATGR